MEIFFFFFVEIIVWALKPIEYQITYKFLLFKAIINLIVNNKLGLFGNKYNGFQFNYIGQSL